MKIVFGNSLQGLIKKAGLATFLFALAGTTANAADIVPKWEPCGWGGGGWFWSTIFHPTKDGVIYLGLDVGGVCKTTDHGKNWKKINNGLTDYGVYSLAVDRSNPETVYAATQGGLHKSTDGGEKWQLLPNTGRKELRITAERNRSVRAIAVDPTHGNNVYAASPGGKVYKSTDGGRVWKIAYAKKNEQEAPDILPIQFGKVNGEYFGCISFPVEFPAGVKPEEGVGFGLTFKGDKTLPNQSLLVLKMTNGATYHSKNLRDMFKDDQWRDIVVKAQDFAVAPDYAKKNPEQAKALPAIPQLDSVKGVDFVCSGNLPAESSQVKVRKFFFAVTRTPDGRSGTVEKPVLLTARDFSTNKVVQTYGNINLEGPLAGPVYAVAVSAKNPALVIAATDDSGLVLSEDAGQTWRELNTPKKAASAVFAETDPNIIYGAFHKDGVWKSTDKGKTWTRSSEGISTNSSLREVAVSPVNPLDVYAVGSEVYVSNDGGKSWKGPAKLTVDLEGNPTLHYDAAHNRTPRIERAMNVAINPLNPKEVFLSADWRSAWSGDGGLTWSERERGADISCITDIRFSKGRVYVTAMDEGTLVTEDNGKKWRQLWPLKYNADVSGHYWRVAVDNINGVDRIITTMSPWNAKLRRVVYSEDGGKTFKDTASGLPDYIVTPNTMWGQGHPHALAVDPKNPKVVYLGIDGDPAAGKMGGGVFKSEDGGHNWKQLANQPGSRRMFFGLAVDPTDSKRIYWGACAERGGLYRSEDSGVSWIRVFDKDQWLFNVLVTGDGTIYCPGKNLWRSTDHGKTWQQLTKLNDNRTILGLETDPRDPKTVWFSTTTWNDSAEGAVYKTRDGGVTWQEITGNLPHKKPQILRFNPDTQELWAGHVGLYKIKQ